MMVGNYLTVSGRNIQEDMSMIANAEVRFDER